MEIERKLQESILKKQEYYNLFFGRFISDYLNKEYEF